MLGLESISEFVEGEQTTKPSEYEATLNIFFDKGIGYTEFCNYPLPYIYSMLKVEAYKQKLEKEAIKKAKRKNNG